MSDLKRGQNSSREETAPVESRGCHSDNKPMDEHCSGKSEAVIFHIEHDRGSKPQTGKQSHRAQEGPEESGNMTR